MAVNLNKDTVYRAAKPKDKDYFINDGGGLNLVVGKNGTKLWRFIYTFAVKRKKLAFGAYPGITLEAAKRKAEGAREQIACGIDPVEVRDQAKQEKQLSKQNQARIKEGLSIIDSFADVTRQWLESISHLTSATTHQKKASRIERLAFPALGNKPIKEIKSADVLAALKPMFEKQQLETAHRLYSEISSIFAYASCITIPATIPRNPLPNRYPRKK